MVVVGHVYWWWTKMPKNGNDEASNSSTITPAEFSNQITKITDWTNEEEELCTCDVSEYPPWTQEIHVKYS